MTEPSWDLWTEELRDVTDRVMPLQPETLVEYTGPFEKARGLWVVVGQVGDERYTLESVTFKWERLNVSRDEIVPVRPDAPEEGESRG